MDLSVFYDRAGGSYEDVLFRLSAERIVRKFVLRFADDPTFADLTAAVKDRKAEEAFRAAHTLKGICLNLGFKRLFDPVEALTELLRPRDASVMDSPQFLALFDEVNAAYRDLAEAIGELDTL